MRTQRGFALLAAPQEPIRDLAPGVRIAGKYELTRKLGAGAMGQVWAAKHVSLREEVAIKLVLRHASHDDGSRVDRRFLVEARVASQLSRKTRHVVSVTDHGDEGPYAYLVMELLEGESLDARLARTGPMPLGKVVAMIYQIARALSLAHADGIVHRDLKPSNVFVTVDEDGKALIKLLDFGVAKLRRVVTTDTSRYETLPGCLIGTPAYMSPEQARGEPIDHRADVWALAVIAYELLTTAFPFDGESAVELFARICRVEPTPISEHRSDLPLSIGALFARAFAERIEDRFPTAPAFAAALEQAASESDRLVGRAPAPMGAISLPPPASIPRVRVAGVRRPKGPSSWQEPGLLPPPAVSQAASRPSPVPPEASAPLAPTPPAPTPDADEPRAAVGAETSAIVAAGVPRRRAPWSRMVAVAVALLAFGVTATLLAIHFEKDVVQDPYGATATRVSLPPPDESARDLVPSPPPVDSPPPVETSPPPPVPLSRAQPTAPAPRSPAPPAPVSSSPALEPPAATSATSAQVAVKHVDRSEVF